MVAVIVPVGAGDCRHRQRNTEWTLKHWGESGWPVFTGTSDREPFSRAQARNNAARAAGDWTIGIFVDADIVVRDLKPIKKAVKIARKKRGLVLPHDECHSLTAAGTEKVMNGDESGWSEIKHINRSPSGVFVIHREAWETLGGQDERFVGWGFEDSSFLDAAKTLVPVNRLSGQIFHCWHPVAPEKANKDAHYQANLDLRDRYRQARHDPEAMRHLLAERHG